MAGLRQLDRPRRRGKIWRSSVPRQKKSDKPDDPGPAELIQRFLKELPETEREVIRRFYLLGQSPRQICRDLKLSNAQFLDIKKRAREK